MRTIGRNVLIAISVLLCSCTDSYNAEHEAFTEQCKRLIGESDMWKVIQVNDSVVVCIPYLNAANNQNPVVINLNNMNR